MFGPDKKLDAMYYLKEGYVRQYAKSPKGDLLYLHIYKPGSFFPLMWLYTDLEVRYFYETITTTRVVKAPMPDIKEFISKNPDIAEYFVSKLLLVSMVFLVEWSRWLWLLPTPRRRCCSCILPKCLVSLTGKWSISTLHCPINKSPTGSGQRGKQRPWLQKRYVGKV
jgi:hypothetical protein